MILAAGRGVRMQPLTDHIPKPLLTVAGKPLLAHHLIALKKAGIREIVINISHLATKIQQALGDGSDYGVKIHYSVEETALETGGGIHKALPLLGSKPFLVVSGDIWTDFPFHQLSTELDGHLAHLVLVDNPPYHPEGDFALQNDRLFNEGDTKFTFANIGIYHPNLFNQCEAGVFPLVNLLRPAIAANQISGEYYRGDWVNVGTPEEWQHLAARF